VNLKHNLPLFFILALPTLLTSFVLSSIYLFDTKGYSIHGVTPTRSMYPTFKDDTKLILNWNRDSFINRNLTNEIIVFAKSNICHRCIIDEGEWLTTKGDNNFECEHLTRDEVKAIFIVISTNPFFEMLRYGWFG